MGNFPRPGTLMQVIDVLTTEEQPPVSLLQSSFEAGQGEMSRIGLSLKQVSSPHVVECVNLIWISGERLGCSQFHGIETSPKSILVAEGAKAALSRDSCAGQYEDVHQPF